MVPKDIFRLKDFYHTKCNCKKKLGDTKKICLSSTMNYPKKPGFNLYQSRHCVVHHQYVNLSIYLSIYLSICLYIYKSVNIFECLPNYLSIYLSIHTLTLHISLTIALSPSARSLSRSASRLSIDLSRIRSCILKT